ncbi:single-stranded DNA-binding protein [Fibrella sp. HMF5335]|uniref:Single-stranded DNA-binding protein n=1 Tax=Fibrella rubiginis TaxID=2817060 RepID=A0A939GIM6_9BACT|nr:single-stranded DNA-binding protein [Fibrella rubiginis]MBO0939001.1 single-stranded DNA-binding protein [Fibrella rubiginis]
MASLNKVTLIGNLGADPEVRYLDGGGVVAQFNVATTEKYTNRNGERVEQTEWFRVELWNEQAKVAEQYLRKGNPVYIEGRLRTETWTDKEGKERFSLRVRASTMQLLGSRNDEANANQEAAPRQQQQAAPAQPPRPQAAQPAAATRPAAKPAPAPAASFDSNGADDDLPF